MRGASRVLYRCVLENNRPDAASVSFDGICVNDHHQNAWGLMPYGPF